VTLDRIVVVSRILVRELIFIFSAQMRYHIPATDNVADPVAP